MIRSFCVSCVLVLVLGTSLVWAQEGAPPSSPGCTEILWQDLSTTLSDGARVGTAPLRFESSEWVKTGAVFGGTVLCFLLDAPVRDLMQRQRSSTNDDLGLFTERYGRGDGEVVLGAGLYLGGLLAGSEDLRVTGRMLLEGLAYAGIINVLSKSAFGRAQPYTGEDPLSFHWFETGPSSTSFPSGHTTVAFVTSSILSRRIRWWPATVVLYSLATGTALQRMYDNKHWLSDTMLGAVLGIVVGEAITAEEGKDGEPRSRLEPTLSERGIGIRWTLRW